MCYTVSNKRDRLIPSGDLSLENNLSNERRTFFMSKRLLFIFNPHSGKAQMKNNLCDIIDLFVKNGYEVTVHPTQFSKDALQVAKENAANFDLIVCSGGDGTVNEVISGLMECENRPLVGYIPAGTVNDFASSLGLSGNMLQAAKSIMEGEVFSYDVGKMNQQYFNYVTGFGLFTDVSYQTSQEAKNLLGRLAYLLEGAKQLANIPSYRIKVEYDGKVIEDQFMLGLVTNSVSVGGFKNIVGRNHFLMDDGLFEVTLVRTPQNLIELNKIINAFLQNSNDCDGLYTFSTKELKFTCEDSVPWTLDGEFGGSFHEVIVKNEQKAVQLLVPKQPVWSENAEAQNEVVIKEEEK